MTDDELTQLETLAQAATPGPWVNMGSGSFFGQIRCNADGNSEWTLICVMPEADDRTEDFDFIAAARQAMPELIAEVKRLKEALMEMVYQHISFDDKVFDTGCLSANENTLDLLEKMGVVEDINGRLYRLKES